MSLKVEVNQTEDVSNIELPCLMRSISETTIVLVNIIDDKNVSGMVVQSSNNNEIGLTVTESVKYYLPFKGSITLTQN